MCIRDRYNTNLAQLEKVPGTTPHFRHKETIKRLRLSLRSMNPLAMSSQTGGGRVTSKRDLYLKWVKDNYGAQEVKKLLAAEAQYYKLLRKLDSWLSEPEVFARKGSYGHLNKLRYK